MQPYTHDLGAERWRRLLREADDQRLAARAKAEARRARRARKAIDPLRRVIRLDALELQARPLEASAPCEGC